MLYCLESSMEEDSRNALSDLGSLSDSESDCEACAYTDEEKEYNGCFEGPEKTLEVCFKPDVGAIKGCRSLTRSQLNQICLRARCTILSRISNNYMDAYILSESSLFVYKYKVVIKTCGTTTLLRCIAYLLKNAGVKLGMELEWVGYSRKNFTFPGDQLYPHSDFEQELEYLKRHQHLSARLNGNGHVLGPITGDHWFVYVADKYDRPDITATDRIINIMMFDLHPDKAALFERTDKDSEGKYLLTEKEVAEKMTREAGIYSLVPGAMIDGCAFEPCGYSMNAIQFESYYTIHVTPESSCSYASFETNNPYRSYRSIINNVLNVFRPKRFVLTMIADEAGLKTMIENPFEQVSVHVPRFGMYSRTSLSSTKFEGDCCCALANFNLNITSNMGFKKRTLSHI